VGIRNEFINNMRVSANARQSQSYTLKEPMLFLLAVVPIINHHNPETVPTWNNQSSKSSSSAAASLA
jgi:hypothetical protein